LEVSGNLQFYIFKLNSFIVLCLRRMTRDLELRTGEVRSPMGQLVQRHNKGIDLRIEDVAGLFHSRS
jgi:hypothetical protein